MDNEDFDFDWEGLECDIILSISMKALKNASEPCAINEVTNLGIFGKKTKFLFLFILAYTLDYFHLWVLEFVLRPQARVVFEQSWTQILLLNNCFNFDLVVFLFIFRFAFHKARAFGMFPHSDQKSKNTFTLPSLRLTSPLFVYSRIRSHS